MSDVILFEHQIIRIRCSLTKHPSGSGKLFYKGQNVHVKTTKLSVILIHFLPCEFRASCLRMLRVPQQSQKTYFPLSSFSPGPEEGQHLLSTSQWSLCCLWSCNSMASQLEEYAFLFSPEKSQSACCPSNVEGRDTACVMSLDIAPYTLMRPQY